MIAIDHNYFLEISHYENFIKFYGFINSVCRVPQETKAGEVQTSFFFVNKVPYW